MLSETVKPAEEEKQKHKQLDREVRDMVTAITDRVTHLQKPGSSLHHRVEDDDDHCVRIITLAGSNTGATMRSELDDKHNLQAYGLSQPEPEALSAYVNSNFQAVNNSIMFSSSYTTNDPGVHLDVTDVLEQHHAHKPDKHAKKGKKKDKDTSKVDQHTEQSN